MFWSEFIAEQFKFIKSIPCHMATLNFWDAKHEDIIFKNLFGNLKSNVFLMVLQALQSIHSMAFLGICE